MQESACWSYRRSLERLSDPRIFPVALAQSVRQRSKPIAESIILHCYTSMLMYCSRLFSHGQGGLLVCRSSFTLQPTGLLYRPNSSVPWPSSHGIPQTKQKPQKLSIAHEADKGVCQREA